MTKGYKALNKKNENRYGFRFEVDKIYNTTGPLRFGINGNGFHFCKRLEDTLRYVPAMEEEISIAKVTSFNEKMEIVDEYHKYFDLYVARCLRIDKILTREEIIQMFLFNYPNRVVRFVSGFKLTKEEIELFKLQYEDYPEVIKAIKYYQEKDLDAYTEDYNKILAKKFDARKDTNER